IASHQRASASCATAVPVAIASSMPARRAVRCQFLPRLRLIVSCFPSDGTCSCACSGAWPHLPRANPHDGPRDTTAARRPAASVHSPHARTTGRSRPSVGAETVVTEALFATLTPRIYLASRMWPNEDRSPVSYHQTARDPRLVLPQQLERGSCALDEDR